MSLYIVAWSVGPMTSQWSICSAGLSKQKHNACNERVDFSHRKSMRKCDVAGISCKQLCHCCFCLAFMLFVFVAATCQPRTCSSIHHYSSRDVPLCLQWRHVRRWRHQTTCTTVPWFYLPKNRSYKQRQYRVATFWTRRDTTGANAVGCANAEPCYSHVSVSNCKRQLWYERVEYWRCGRTCDGSPPTQTNCHSSLERHLPTSSTTTSRHCRQCDVTKLVVDACM